MKLSEQLIEQAEWWMILGPGAGEDIYHQRAAYHLIYTDELNFYKIQSSPDRATLCLLEAEYQKDIESQEYKSIAPSVERNKELLSDWAKRHTFT